MHIRPKDYVAVNDELFFAVVSDIQEDERVLTFLRYIKDEKGMHKLSTKKAQKYIEGSFPDFAFHSQYADIELHGIPLKSISCIYRPEETVIKLQDMDNPDAIQADAKKMIQLLVDAGIEKKNIGITGSLMLDSQNPESDIDMVVYGRDIFFKIRTLIRQYIETGALSDLTHTDWEDAWQRRDCELNIDEYKKYEKRKFNKCVCGNTKVDFTMIPLAGEAVDENRQFKKLYKENIIANVIDDTFAFDFPARFYIDHDMIEQVVVYTATYIGQAEKGDKIEVAGYLEEDIDGNKRLVVGTSREATGEYIRVVE